MAKQEWSYANLFSVIPNHDLQKNHDLFGGSKYFFVCLQRDFVLIHLQDLSLLGSPLLNGQETNKGTCRKGNTKSTEFALACNSE